MLSKILYVSPIWTNLARFKLTDVHESGMPAFSEPLRNLLDNGHTVNILWIDEINSPNLEDDFFLQHRRVRIVASSKFGLVRAFLLIFTQTIREIIKNKPDTVFCHGALSAGAILGAIFMRKKIVVRVYGTNKYASELIRLGPLKFSLTYPFIYLMFALKTDAIIATDDGSMADDIFLRIGRARRFFFLKNGLPSGGVKNSTRFLNFLCVGRVEKKKNQIAAVDFFERVAKDRADSRLIFIGGVSCPAYFNDLKKRIQSSRFRDQIKLLGPLQKSDLLSYYADCEAVLSFQDVSNFGNIAIESLKYGCLFLTFNEPIFSNLFDTPDNRGALLGATVQDLAREYESLDVLEKDKIRGNAMAGISSLLETWEVRAAKETAILLGKQC